MPKNKKETSNKSIPEGTWSFRRYYRNSFHSMPDNKVANLWFLYFIECPAICYECDSNKRLGQYVNVSLPFSKIKLGRKRSLPLQNQNSNFTKLGGIIFLEQIKQPVKPLSLSLNENLNLLILTYEEINGNFLFKTKF